MDAEHLVESANRRADRTCGVFPSQIRKARKVREKGQIFFDMQFFENVLTMGFRAVAMLRPTPHLSNLIASGKAQAPRFLGFAPGFRS